MKKLPHVYMTRDRMNEVKNIYGENQERKL